MTISLFEKVYPGAVLSLAAWRTLTRMMTCPTLVVSGWQKQSNGTVSVHGRDRESQMYETSFGIGKKMIL